MNEIAVEVLRYIERVPVAPMTAGMIAAAIDKDPSVVSQMLANMALRATPMVARQPVAPERIINKMTRFEYMSLAMADKLGVVMEKKPPRAKRQAVPPMFKHCVEHPHADLRLRDEPLPVKQSVELPPLQQSVESLARLVGKRIGQVMMEALQDEIESQLEAMSEEVVERWVNETVNRTEPRNRLPKVLIAGLLPDQREMIKREFGEVFDLRFYMTDDNLKKLRRMLPGVHHFITFTSKIEHATEGIAKNLGIKINRCSGGMTMLRQTLEELFINA